MPGDIIGLDVYVSSGEGMGKEVDCRTTVYKREMDTQYNLKSKVYPKGRSTMGMPGTKPKKAIKKWKPKR